MLGHIGAGIASNRVSANRFIAHDQLEAIESM